MLYSLGSASSQVWGTLPGWLTLLSLVAVGFILWRGGAGTAVEGLQNTNRELERQIHALQAQNEAQAKEIAELRTKTDVTLALAPLLEWSTNHETRAQQRHEGTMNVLELIAERLGKETDE